MRKNKRKKSRNRGCIKTKTWKKRVGRRGGVEIG